MTPPFQIIIVLYNHADCIARCLNSLEQVEAPQYHITVLDNASSDGGADVVAREFPQIQLIRSDHNRGFAGGNNLAAARGPATEFLFLLNPDTELRPGALNALAEAFQARPRLGVAGCKLLCADGRTIQHVGATIDANALTHHIGEGEEDRGQFTGLIPCPYVQGAAFAVRRRLWDQLGGFDEGFHPAYFEEADFCKRARDAGWDIAAVCEAAAIHHQDPAGQIHDGTFLRLLFRGRAHYLIKHYRMRDWLTRYLPAELRWLFSSDSRRYRRIALRALWEAWTGTQPK